jgi:acetylornithine deacetylase
VIDPVELLEELVRIDSVNPAMGGPGEHEIVAHLVEILHDLGLEASTPEVVDGRRNLIATLPGTSSAPTLLLEAHLDTVAMPADGLAGSRTQDRVAGRGSCDTKGSVAAMIAAVAEPMGSGEERATVVFAGVADEEDRMLSVEAVLGRRVTPGGVPFGTDASNLSGVGGVPGVVLGPGSIDQAHTDDEWVPVGEVRQGAVVRAEMARRSVRHHAERGSAR